MKPLHRSLAGLSIAIVTVPFLISLLACLPVPLGDAEKSRVNPALSGIWISPEEESVFLIEPYDKRTWLVSNISIYVNEKHCPELEVSPGGVETDYELLIRQLQQSDFRCARRSEEFPGLYKVWRTKLGGQWFMTWEGKGFLDVEVGFAPFIWFGFKIGSTSENEFSLWMVYEDYDGFATPDVSEKLDALEELDPPYDPRVLKAARKAVERVISRNVDDDDLYDGEIVLHRLLPEHYELFEETAVVDMYSEL